MIHHKSHYGNRHFRAGWNPAGLNIKAFSHSWIPACAGMTKQPLFIYVYLFALLTLPPAAQAASLGRLFFTPEQRAQLELGRMDKTVPAAPPPTELMVNGIVQKNDGGRTVWINGVPQNAGSSDKRAPDSLPVAVPGMSNPIKMKVGQKLMLNKSAPKDTPAGGK